MAGATTTVTAYSILMIAVLTASKDDGMKVFRCFQAWKSIIFLSVALLSQAVMAQNNDGPSLATVYMACKVFENPENFDAKLRTDSEMIDVIISSTRCTTYMQAALDANRLVSSKKSCTPKSVTPKQIAKNLVDYMDSLIATSEQQPEASMLVQSPGFALMLTNVLLNKWYPCPANPK